MLFESIFPQLPSSLIEIIIYISGILGAILMIYSQFVEAENRRDLIRMIGALGVLCYSIFVMNIIFILMTFGVFVASLVEFIEIYIGYHKHTRKDVDIYKYIGNGKKK